MTEGGRPHQKTDRTPAELAELKADRVWFSRERPGPEDLAGSGDFEGPYRQGDLLALLSALATLKQERERRGLSVADVSQRTGLDQATIGRLEEGKLLNPDVATLWKYADAVGMTLKFSAERVPAGAGG
ncbi:MAG: helix-turn-helix transcriptional regulator [Isosphaeraceae bacterium]